METLDFLYFKLEKFSGYHSYDCYYNNRMQTRSAVSAAHLLFQSVEATLPKQKKNLAVTEYKNSMVAHKRRTKARQEENGDIILLCT